MKKWFSDSRISELGSYASIASIVVAVIGVIEAYLSGKNIQNGGLYLYYTMFIFALLIILSCYVNILYREKKAQMDAEIASRWDYKFYAPNESESVKAIFDHYGLDIDRLLPNQVVSFRKSDNHYISPGCFFSHDNDFIKDFSCLPVREMDKSQKCILQVSFIPEDREGNIPIIVRSPSHHFSTNDLKAPLRLGFISFSPVPLSFNIPFDLKRCYYREVPDRIEPTAIEDIGFVFKKDSRNRIYLFFLCRVIYGKSHFRSSDGKVDWETVDNIFLNETSESGKVKQYFKKDHDSIISIQKVTDVYQHFCQGDAPGWIDDGLVKKEKIASDALLQVEKECLALLPGANSR